MNIIGISALFHDAACCLIQDGKLVAAAEEERFSRIKHDPAMPSRSFLHCLEAGGISITDVDCVAFYEDPRKKLGRQLWMSLPELPSIHPHARFKLDSRRPERLIRFALGFEGRIEFVDHHLSHAASSFFFSGFPDAALMTTDGVGEWATTSYGRAEGNTIDLFEEVHFPDSLGILYSSITSYLGFSVNDAEYKVMGLAPYGRPRFADQIRKLVRTGPRGSFSLDLAYFDFLGGGRMYSDAMAELFGRPPREAESEIELFHQDIAKSLQTVLEEILLEKANFLKKETGSENLCLAGGVALNCVANGRIRRDGPFSRLFVQPASSDAGGALGAAAVAHLRLAGVRPSTKPLQHVYLGPRAKPERIDELMVSTKIPHEDFRGNETGLVAAVARRLADGKVIGWMHGPMEFGPRSLGARSILADPRGPEMRDRINAQVKKREAFRPFAPAVLLDRAQEHFELPHASPFMLETCQVRSSLSLPAITHVDGSARVQTVEAEHSPRFAALIREFDRLTGCPLLLNTSFNLRGEPIVLDEVDALWCFVRSEIDCLVLEDYVIDRPALPEIWLKLGKVWESRRLLQRKDRDEGRKVSQLVYTFH